MELLDDAAVFFDKAFRYLSGIPAQRVHQPINKYYAVPSTGGRSDIGTPSGNEFDPMIEDGVLCTHSWLDGS